ncbi:hypothetical protein BDV23DRAFT_144345 [Aspergillus alliaceus]|uniref:Uncharacterized protein n=1 Tax=Petromyces alliaceus TaxID=209559 RepID=A0A5N7CQY4_PETAA|nr:hypothetical protein BDV23DRAFT_144345 [Aspergillus alliaceus]
MILNARPMAGGAVSAVPFTRLMNALGSRRNGAEFAVLISGHNSCKSRVRIVFLSHSRSS